jgi:hypothetical protein
MEDFSDILHDFFLAAMSNVHTAMPGIIQSYNAKTKTVSVLPSVKMTFVDGTVKSMPIITDVQVVFPGTKNTVMQFELVKGDSCLLICSSASLENWVNNKVVEVEAGDARRFALTDAFCIPGVFPAKEPGKVGQGKGLELMHKNGKIWITDQGKIELNGNSKQLVTHAELAQALATFMSALNSHIHSNGNDGAPTGAPITPMSLDISSSKTTTILTGG